MELFDRIKKLRTALGFSQIHMAKSLGIAPSTFQYYERGERPVPSDTLVRLIAEFNVNPDWLLTGAGEMFERSENALPDEFVRVPLLDDVKAAAGAGAYVNDETHSREIIFRRDWIKHHNISANTLSCIHLTGDSMFPTLIPGDVLLVDHSQTQPLADRIFVIRADDGLVVKRSGGLNGGELTLISDNPVIGKRVVDLSAGEASVVGRVVWYGRAL